MIVAFIIWTGCSALFLGISVYDRKLDKPAGFFSNSEPPQVTDVQKYNREVSRLWLWFAILMEFLGLPFLFLKQNSAWFILPVLGTVALCLVLVVRYMKIESKYRK